MLLPLHTTCDFHNFGLIFAGQMHCLPQRLKSTLFEIFSNGGCPKGTRSVEKISKNVDFSLWGNRATTWEYFLTFSKVQKHITEKKSETKIRKIRHSVHETINSNIYDAWVGLQKYTLHRWQSKNWFFFSVPHHWCI